MAEEQAKGRTRRADAAKKSGGDYEKTQAEIDAEIANMNAEAVKMLAEAEMIRANIDGAVSYNGQQRIILDRMQHEEKLRSAQDLLHHTFHFTSDVNDKSARECMAQLSYWMRTDPGANIEIIFSSPGGSVIAGMALFDFIQEVRSKGHLVTTSTIGYAASMAGILLQADDRRVMGREAYILIHQVSSFVGGSFGAIEDEVEFIKKIQSRILDIFAARSKLTKKQLEANWKRKDWWLDSDEALRLGIVDEVRGTKFDPTPDTEKERVVIARSTGKAAATRKSPRRKNKIRSR